MLVMIPGQLSQQGRCRPPVPKKICSILEDLLYTGRSALYLLLVAETQVCPAVKGLGFRSAQKLA